jgi:hypothetical protein
MTPHAYGSPVAGYVRSPRLNDPELDVLEAQIRRYALEYGYNLAKVFREEGISSVAAWRPELEKLVRGLERREWVGVIVPDEGHWSSKTAVAGRISGRIQLLGWIINLSPSICHRDQ